MTINGTGPLFPNPTLGRTPAAQPVAAPVEAAIAAPAAVPTDAAPAGGTANTDRIQAAAAAPAAAMPWDAVKAAKSAADRLRDSLETQKNWQNRATVAASVLGVTNAIGKGTRAADQIANGDVVTGSANMAAAAADGVSTAMTGIDALRGTRDFKSIALRLKVSGNIAGSFTGITRGFEEFNRGDRLTGATRMAGSAASGVSAGLSVAGMLAREGSAIGRAAGRFAAPLGVVGGMTDGAIAVQRGVGQIMDGNVGQGLATAGKGVLDGAASASFMASVIPSGSRALTTFGKAAGPLGAAAGAVAGGMEVYQALNTNPPDVERAVLGGAKAAGSAMLMMPPPGNVAGGAILIGTALYENREAIADTAVAAGQAVAGAAATAANAVADVASDAAGAVADVASDAANAVADTASNAAKSVGNFFSSLW